MKEYVLDLTQAFQRGLRPDFRNARNEAFLVQAQNVQCTSYGLCPYDPVQIPIPQSELAAWSLNLSWPNPQIHRGRKHTFLTTHNRFFYVNEADWSLQEMDIYDYANQSSYYYPELGSPWQLVDFGSSWFFVNGLDVVFHSGKQLMLGETDKVFGTKVVRITAGCAHKGRAFFGGFDPDKTWNTALASLFGSAITSSLGVQTGIQQALSGFENNFIWWSSIGGGDALFLFDGTLSTDGWIPAAQYTSASKPLQYDYLRRNESGWMPMEWQGMVRKMLPLGEDIAVYGDSGVSLLRMVSDREVNTVGQKTILRIGVIGSGAAAGDDKQHLFMDTSGDLWLWELGKTPNKLGYREFFLDFLNTEVVISYDEQDQRFFICNGYKTFVLTKQGLTESTQVVTSAVFAAGGVIGLGSSSVDIDRNAIIVSDVFDFNRMGIKTVTSVELGFEGEGTVYVAVDYRYKRHVPWARSTYVPLNERGFGFPIVSGVDFRLVVKFDDFESITPPKYCHVRFKEPDKHNLRGAYVKKPGISP